MSEAIPPADAGRAPPDPSTHSSPGGTDLILLPTLNEEAGLSATLAELARTRGFRGQRCPPVLIVDGHSTDRTVAIARAAGAEVLVQAGRGKGAAMREGLAWARAHGFRSVGVIDADGTYPCDRLPALFGLLGLGAEVVIGVRRPTQRPSATPRDLVHRVGNTVLNLTAAQFSRGPLLDVCSGFWGLRTDVLDELNLQSDGFEIESELFVKSFRLGLEVAQIPVEYRPRIGEAKLRAAQDGVRILLSIVRHSTTPRRAGATARASRFGSHQQPTSPSAWIAVLHALLTSLNPASVLVVSTDGRREEASQLAGDLAEFPIGSRIRFQDTTADELTVPATPGSLSVRPVIVRLPGADEGPFPGATVLVEVPRSRRIIRLGPGGFEESGGRRHDTLSGELRLERATVGRPRLLSILGAAIDPSGLHRELTLLRSNARGSGAEVFRVRAPASGAWGTFVVRARLALQRGLGSS
jgi:hypothetical protein